MPPSGAPTRPSALSGPCHMSFHLAPAAMTPGISVTVTSRAGAGCGKFCSPAPPALRCCCLATAISLRAIADPRKQQAIAHTAFNFISPPTAWPGSAGKTQLQFAPGAAVYTGARLKAQYAGFFHDLKTEEEKFRAGPRYPRTVVPK